MMLAAYFLDRFWTVFCITVAVGMGAFAWSGFAVNHLDIAPQHASILMGITNTFATIPGIVSPSLTGFIVQSKSKEEWTTVFYISAGIYCVGCVFYWFFASGEIQPWAVVKKRESIEKGENKGYVNSAMELKD
jgi:MFS transporter, ACS family, solute carrier family 17 (sodium-dependent inorganic phosphate cotransporter), other